MTSLREAKQRGRLITPLTTEKGSGGSLFSALQGRSQAAFPGRSRLLSPPIFFHWQAFAARWCRVREMGRGDTAEAAGGGCPTARSPLASGLCLVLGTRGCSCHRQKQPGGRVVLLSWLWARTDTAQSWLSVKHSAHVPSCPLPSDIPLSLGCPGIPCCPPRTWGPGSGRDGTWEMGAPPGAGEMAGGQWASGRF